MDLLDPDNPGPVISSDDSLPNTTHMPCGIREGMPMSTVVATLGKPTALGITSALGSTLVYGSCDFGFENGKVCLFGFASEGTGKAPAPEHKHHPVPRLTAKAYYQRLNSLFSTNDEDRALSTLATNAMISVANLKAGEAGPFRLGMTMSEFVDVMGKPQYFCRFTPKRATLWYGGSYDFRGDSLSDYSVGLPKDCSGIRFDNGLSATARLSEFLQTFGKPLHLTRDRYNFYLTYTFDGTYLTLCFRLHDLIRDPVAAKAKAEFCGLSLHYRGPSEACGEAYDRLTEVVSGATGLDREKVYLVKMYAKDVDRAAAVIERETGRTLSAEQRHRVAEALQEHRRAIQKAYADDAE